jgi:hypothetical protein
MVFMNGMNSLWLVLILALNFGLSWWNARACGRAWIEAKAVGGYVRFLVWCGAVQSAIGFSSVFLFPLIFLAHAAAPDAFTDAYVKGAIDLWYLTIIFPALGSGLAITIESWIAASRERSLGNLGIAAYNTFAEAHNLIGAVDSIGPALESVGKMFVSGAAEPDDPRDWAARIGLMIALLVAATALAAGVLLTVVLIRRYAGTVPLPPRAQLSPRAQAA